MPRPFKGFGRRKSIANELADAPEEPAGGSVSSFKVFERPPVDPGSKSFDGGLKYAKALKVPTARPNTSHLEDDNMFDHLGKNR
jgi:hypothetical protein